MKRYLLFCGFAFYPLGGWWDFEGSFDSITEAWAEYRSKMNESGEPLDWAHIIDTESGECVKSEGSSCYGDVKDLSDNPIALEEWKGAH